MMVSELFYSVQGEGALVGVPSVFIRTSGCNLRCAWCDTPYTSWRAEGEEMAIGKIVDYVRAHSTGHTVLTGGEPMIAPEVAALTRLLRGAGQHITIETAGTVFAEVECDLMSISPKLANSTPRHAEAGHWTERHERLRIQPETLARLMRAHPYQLKFVVMEAADMDEIDSLVAALDAAPSRVVLMPEGADAAVLHQRALWMVEACKQRGFRFSPRLHIDLYGNRRGV